jgi:hypothetical protein
VLAALVAIALVTAVVARRELVAAPLDLDVLAALVALVVAMQCSPSSPRSWAPRRSTSTCSPRWSPSRAGSTRRPHAASVESEP